MTVVQERFEVELAVAESFVADPVPHESDVLDPRVLKGAELLDTKCPGWADRIDLESFELSDPANCVLGQVYRTRRVDACFRAYADGVYKLEVKPFEYGFAVETFGEYESLQDDWQLAIQARKTK